MFILISDNTQCKYFINTDNILWFSPDGKQVSMIGDNRIPLAQESVDRLISALSEVEDLPTASTARPSEIGALLTQLHNALGGRGEAKLTTDRKARLTTRLKDFSPEELMVAAQALGADEFMQGANDNGKRYGTIDYLIRTSANINKWLEEAPKKKKKMF